MNNKTLGTLLFTLSLLAMIGYFCWLFLTPEDVVVLGRPLSEWAVIVPIILVVYAFLFIMAWVGWAMASTPPPLPLTKKPPEERTRKRKDGLSNENHLARCARKTQRK